LNIFEVALKNTDQSMQECEYHDSVVVLFGNSD